MKSQAIHASPIESADALSIAGMSFSSRLLIGTGKYSSGEAMAGALRCSGCEIVTVALRRVDLDAPPDEGILDFVPDDLLVMPNTSGAVDGDEAIRLARLARIAELHDALGRTWIKLEVTPDPRHLLPDGTETLKAAEELVREGFVVLPYIGADPILAKRLEEVGCATVMPLGSWIGSNQGLKTKDAIELIVDQSNVTVVVDAGLGAPSHAAQALELGAGAVLVNTAIATSRDPGMAAAAFAQAVQAGRLGFLSGLPGSGMPTPSSPQTGFIE